MFLARETLLFTLFLHQGVKISRGQLLRKLSIRTCCLGGVYMATSFHLSETFLICWSPKPSCTVEFNQKFIIRDIYLYLLSVDLPYSIASLV